MTHLNDLLRNPSVEGTLPAKLAGLPLDDREEMRVLVARAMKIIVNHHRMAGRTMPVSVAGSLGRQERSDQYGVDWMINLPPNLPHGVRFTVSTETFTISFVHGGEVLAYTYHKADGTYIREARSSSQSL